MLFFIFGKKYTMEAVNTGAKKPKGDIWFFLGKYVYTGLALLALIAGAFYYIFYKTLNSKKLGVFLCNFFEKSC